MYTKVSSEYAFDAHPTTLVYIVNIFSFPKTQVSWLNRSFFLERRKFKLLEFLFYLHFFKCLFEVRVQKSTFHITTAERKSIYFNVTVEKTEPSHRFCLELSPCLIFQLTRVKS